MATARKNIVDKATSGFYHCTTRCVRRAFLCGEDHYSGENYDHRREWIQRRLLKLGDIFAADLYRIMDTQRFTGNLRLVEFLGR